METTAVTAMMTTTTTGIRTGPMRSGDARRGIGQSMAPTPSSRLGGGAEHQADVEEREGEQRTELDAVVEEGDRGRLRLRHVDDVEREDGAGLQRPQVTGRRRHDDGRVDDQEDERGDAEPLDQ